MTTPRATGCSRAQLKRAEVRPTTPGRRTWRPRWPCSSASHQATSGSSRSRSPSSRAGSRGCAFQRWRCRRSARCSGKDESHRDQKRDLHQHMPHHRRGERRAHRRRDGQQTKRTRPDPGSPGSVAFRRMANSAARDSTTCHRPGRTRVVHAHARLRDHDHAEFVGAAARSSSLSNRAARHWGSTAPNRLQGRVVRFRRVVRSKVMPT